jgi:hypothetical protein
MVAIDFLHPLPPAHKRPEACIAVFAWDTGVCLTRAVYVCQCHTASVCRWLGGDALCRLASLGGVEIVRCDMHACGPSAGHACMVWECNVECRMHHAHARTQGACGMRQLIARGHVKVPSWHKT